MMKKTKKIIMKKGGKVNFKFCPTCPSKAACKKAGKCKKKGR